MINRETIENRQAEITQQFSQIENQIKDLNSELLKLQGEYRGYEYIKEKLGEEDATDSTDGSKQTRTRK